MKRSILVTALACAVTACGPEPAPELKFAQYGTDYSEKPDFARVEAEMPLASADLAKLTPENLKAYDQEQIDQIYARLASGPIPDGPFEGGLFFPRGVSGEKRIAEIVGGLPGLAVDLKTQKIEIIGKTLWKGKVFYRGERLLRNRIEDLAALKPLIEGDLADIPKITVNGKDQWLLFPARLYCGQSLLDSRRESIVIDYFFSDELPGYREQPDYLASRRGFAVRDEIRMVRPGFYLGRAYVNRVFLLNFTVYSKEIAERDGPAFAKTGQVTQDCWPGMQARAVVAVAK